MKERFYMGKVSDGQIVIDLNKLNGDQTSLDGRLVEQTSENTPIRKPGYYVVNGELQWVNDAILAKQMAQARDRKAVFQGRESAYRSLRVQV